MGHFLAYRLNLSTIAAWQRSPYPRCSSLACGLLCLLLAGCMSTTLEPKETDPNIGRLEQLATRHISLHLVPRKGPYRTGFQFLFLIIPFSSVYLDTPEAFVRRELQQTLALRGFSTTLPKSSRTREAERLYVEVREVDLSAYDFFFVRRVSASVELRLVRDSPKLGQPFAFQSMGEASSFVRFGFEPQLEEELAEAIKLSVDSGLQALGYPREPHS